MPHVLELSVQRYTILNAKHNAFTSLSLIGIEVGGGAGDAKILAVFSHYGFYLVENIIGKSRRMLSWLG